VQLLTAQLTWTHSNALLDKVKDKDVFLWYAERNFSGKQLVLFAIMMYNINYYGEARYKDGMDDRKRSWNIMGHYNSTGAISLLQRQS